MARAGPRATDTTQTERGPIFSTLRGRLIASHVFVLLLALALVLLMSAGFLRRYEEQAEIALLRELAVPLSVQTATIQRANPGTTLFRVRAIQELNNQAEQLGLRLLLIDPQTARVVFDTDERASLTDQRLTGYQESLTRVANQGRGRREVATLLAESTADDDPLGDVRVVLAAGGRLQPRFVLGVAAPLRRLPLIGRFLPPLMVVAAMSLGVASIAGLVLSRRIAAPVNRLTGAADEIAGGKLEQQVPGEGRDEVGRLVSSFNTMSRQVAATSRIQREFLANIAHELRTPLTSVQGYARALRDGVIEAEPDRDRALATIGRESDRMGSLIGQLLDLARLESGQTRLTVQPVAVEPLLARIEDRFRPDANQRGVELVTQSPPGLSVLADDERLNQILSNLVANALRHTPAGGKVLAAAAPVGDRWIRLTVQDTGEGIPPERLPRIFDRFERGEGNRDGSGFGLGLAIVKELVQLHGGAIQVASIPGIATSFNVDLPAATDDAG